ncbi:MAG: 50S ribosomal protein L9 [Clostridia bacterium]|nr:50S ribosomal protein L9 [Clostridia bacterium]
MKVILLQDIKSVGKKGQVLDASDGYARNFLLPKKMAVIADAANMNALKTKQEANKYKKDMSMAAAKELKEKMKDFELIFKIKAGDNGKIFGSVTSKDIADELNKKYFVEVDKKKVMLDDAIKNLGTYNVEIKLFEGISGTLKVSVEAES